MSRYSSVWEEREGERICRLRDEALDCEADIAATFGMNVIRVAAQGQDIVLSPPSLQTLRNAPFRYGIPFLCPPGRTTGGEFRHRGTVYRLPANGGRHNVHGELGTLPWQAAEQRVDPANGASLHARFVCREHPRPFSYFPHETVYELTYRLKDGTLALEGMASNEGRRHAPLAFGFHPYFAWGGDRSEAKLQLPDCAAEWPRDQEGRASGLPAPTAWTESVRAGMALSDLQGDYRILRLGDSAAAGEARPHVCRLYDNAAGRRVEFRIDALFSALVLFMPSWGNAIALEPHTCVPDAFNLPFAARETGVMELAPGETRSFGWSIQTWKEGD